MTRFDSLKDELFKLIDEKRTLEIGFHIETQKLKVCDELDCKNCYFNISCSDEVKDEWFEEEI